MELPKKITKNTLQQRNLDSQNQWISPTAFTHGNNACIGSSSSTLRNLGLRTSSTQFVYPFSAMDTTGYFPLENQWMFHPSNSAGRFVPHFHNSEMFLSDNSHIGRSFSSLGLVDERNILWKNERRPPPRRKKKKNSNLGKDGTANSHCCLHCPTTQPFWPTCMTHNYPNVPQYPTPYFAPPMVFQNLPGNEGVRSLSSNPLSPTFEILKAKNQLLNDTNLDKLDENNAHHANTEQHTQSRSEKQIKNSEHKILKLASSNENLPTTTLKLHKNEFPFNPINHSRNNINWTTKKSLSDSDINLRYNNSNYGTANFDMHKRERSNQMFKHTSDESYSKGCGYTFSRGTNVNKNVNGNEANFTPETSRRTSMTSYKTARQFTDEHSVDTDSTDITLHNSENESVTEQDKSRNEAKNTWVLIQDDMKLENCSTQENLLHNWKTEISLWRARLIVSLCQNYCLSQHDWVMLHLMVQHPLSLQYKMSLLNAQRMLKRNQDLGVIKLRNSLLYLVKNCENLLLPLNHRHDGWSKISFDVEKPLIMLQGACEILEILGYVRNKKQILTMSYKPKFKIESSIIARITLDLIVISEELLLFTTNKHPYPINVTNLYSITEEGNGANESYLHTHVSSHQDGNHHVDNPQDDNNKVTNHLVHNQQIDDHQLDNQRIDNRKSDDTIQFDNHSFDNHTLDKLQLDNLQFDNQRTDHCRSGNHHPDCPPIGYNRHQNNQEPYNHQFDNHQVDNRQLSQRNNGPQVDDHELHYNSTINSNNFENSSQVNLSETNLGNCLIDGERNNIDDQDIVPLDRKYSPKFSDISFGNTSELEKITENINIIGFPCRYKCDSRTTANSTKPAIRKKRKILTRKLYKESLRRCKSAGSEHLVDNLSHKTNTIAKSQSQTSLNKYQMDNPHGHIYEEITEIKRQVKALEDESGNKLKESPPSLPPKRRQRCDETYPDDLVELEVKMVEPKPRLKRNDRKRAMIQEHDLTFQNDELLPLEQTLKPEKLDNVSQNSTLISKSKNHNLREKLENSQDFKLSTSTEQADEYTFAKLQHEGHLRSNPNVRRINKCFNSPILPLGVRPVRKKDKLLKNNRKSALLKKTGTDLINEQKEPKSKKVLDDQHEISKSGNRFRDIQRNVKFLPTRIERNISKSKNDKFSASKCDGGSSTPINTNLQMDKGRENEKRDVVLKEISIKYDICFNDSLLKHEKDGNKESALKGDISNSVTTPQMPSPVIKKKCESKDIDYLLKEIDRFVSKKNQSSAEETLPTPPPKSRQKPFDDILYADQPSPDEILPEKSVQNLNKGFTEELCHPCGSKADNQISEIRDQDLLPLSTYPESSVISFPTSIPETLKTDFDREFDEISSSETSLDREVEALTKNMESQSTTNFFESSNDVSSVELHHLPLSTSIQFSINSSDHNSLIKLNEDSHNPLANLCITGSTHALNTLKRSSSDLQVGKTDVQETTPSNTTPDCDFTVNSSEDVIKGRDSISSILCEDILPPPVPSTSPPHSPCFDTYMPSISPSDLHISSNSPLNNSRSSQDIIEQTLSPLNLIKHCETPSNISPSTIDENTLISTETQNVTTFEDLSNSPVTSVEALGNETSLQRHTSTKIESGIEFSTDSKAQLDNGDILETVANNSEGFRIKDDVFFIRDNSKGRNSEDGCHTISRSRPANIENDYEIPEIPAFDLVNSDCSNLEKPDATESKCENKIENHAKKNFDNNVIAKPPPRPPKCAFSGTPPPVPPKSKNNFPISKLSDSPSLILSSASQPNDLNHTSTDCSHHRRLTISSLGTESFNHLRTQTSLKSSPEFGTKTASQSEAAILGTENASQSETNIMVSDIPSFRLSMSVPSSPKLSKKSTRFLEFLRKKQKSLPFVNSR